MDAIINPGIQKPRKEKLVEDMKMVVSDAEAILQATAGQAGEEITKLRATMTAKLEDAKERMMALEQDLMEQTRQAAKVTDEYVHENPWQAVAVAGIIGFLTGYLVSHRQA